VAWPPFASDPRESCELGSVLDDKAPTPLELLEEYPQDDRTSAAPATKEHADHPAGRGALRQSLRPS